MSLAATLLGLSALAVVVPGLARRLGRDTGFVVAGALLVALGVMLAAAPRALTDDPVGMARPWLPAQDIWFALRLDALGLLFAVIVLGVGAAVLAYAARYLDVEEADTGRILGLLTFFAASMLGLVLADDLIVLFVFWELTSISSFLLIGGEGRKAGPPATRALLVTSLGGLALLAGLLLLGIEAGTTSLSAVLADPDAVLASPRAPAIAVLVMLGAVTKSAQLPWHFWLPGAMVAPTPISTYLHAATMVKAGIYLLQRLSPVFGALPVWHVGLVLLGFTTAVFGAVVALTKHDLKALLAYSTISQLGLLVGLIGLGTPRALTAAALHTLAHALFKAALFMTVGVVDHATGTRDLRELGGLRRALPRTAAAGGLAALSMAGLPPLLGFVSKEEAFTALLGAAGGELAAGAAAGALAPGGPAWLGPVAVVLAATASLGTVAYTARWYLGIFEGPPRAGSDRDPSPDSGSGAAVPTTLHRIPVALQAPGLVLAVLGLGFGLTVPVLDQLVGAVARTTAGLDAAADPGVHLALWHGLNAPLALSAAVVAVGGLLVLGRRGVQRMQSRWHTPDGAAVFDAAYRGALALGRTVGRPATSLSPAWYLLPILAALTAVGATALGAGGVSVAGTPAASEPSDWALVVLLAASVLAVVQARSRLAAVTALGLTGFLVAGWFVLLGAPDLALTQLLTETLTVAVVIVVFRRLPETFFRGGGYRKLGAALVAVLIGTLAGAATYALTSRRERAAIGTRFLDEGESVTGGTNVVNTILVDFRALDTLGEVTVLAVATLGIYALVRLVRHEPLTRPAPTLPPEGLPERRSRLRTGPGSGPDDDHAPVRVPVELFSGPGTVDSVVLQSLANGLGTVMVLASLWLLVRGHDAVGGGFIGGLTAGAAVVLFYLSHGHERVWHSRWLRIAPLIGAGLLVGVGYGLIGLVRRSRFLAGGKLSLPGDVEVAASLAFDVGVYLVVIAMIVAIVRHLGQGLPEEETPPHHPTTADPTTTPDPSTTADPTTTPDPGARP